MAFSPNGRLLSTGADGEVKLYDVATWRETRTLAGHKSGPSGMAFSPDGKLLATWDQDEDNSIKLWDPTTGALVRTLEGHPSKYLGVMAATFSADGRWLAAASDQKAVRVWEVASGREIATFRGSPGRIHYVESATISPDGRWLITEGSDAAVVWWEITADRTIRVFGHHGQTGIFTFGPDNKILASSGGQDHTIMLWEPPLSKSKSIWPAGR